MVKDLSDIYIKGTSDPLYDSNQIENVTFIETVVAKLYMILMTNKGEVMGDPDFGADIPKLLWKTKFPASTIQTDINNQISKYIPELNGKNYSVNVYILPGNIQDIGIIEINLGIANLNILFK